MILRKRFNKIFPVTALVVLGMFGLARAEAEKTVPETGGTKTPELKPGQCLLLIEPSLMAAGVTKAIPDARKTEIVAARETLLGVEYYGKADFDKLGIRWETFEKKGLEAAAAHLKKLKPKVIRDKRGVAQMATFHHEHSLTASTVLTLEFLALFKESMGDDLVVAIPDRYHIYVFPRLLSDYASYGKELLDIHNDALYPVSTEVFMVNARGIRSIGNYKNN